MGFNMILPMKIYACYHAGSTGPTSEWYNFKKNKWEIQTNFSKYEDLIKFATPDLFIAKGICNQKGKDSFIFEYIWQQTGPLKV